MSKKTLEEKVDEIHEYIVGNPIRNIPGIDNVVKELKKEVAELKQNKADKFDWRKLFSIFAKAKTITP